MKAIITIFSLALMLGSKAALIVNASIPITHTLTVQPIITTTTDGSETATFLGSITQENIIKGFVDTIWSQAGIDVEWLTPTTYASDFAFDNRPNDHSNGSGTPRPTSHLNDIVTAAGSPPQSSSSSVLNMFFVDIVPGFEFTTENTANGLAFLDNNGVTQFVGDNLLSFTLGQEVIASVIAHEIGHNLGLDHIVEAENLLQAGGSPNQGERISAAQITLAFTDNGGLDGFELLTPIIPEPASSSLILLGLIPLVASRRR